MTNRVVTMMRSFETRLLALACWAVALAIGSGFAPGGAVLAQSAASSQSVQELLQAGQKAQRARNHAAAVSYFTRAINSGRLPRKQMTYALYRRAISNRAQKQPAAAISDLNSALFFKGDLSSQDRASAIEERMRAFKDAGLAPTAIATASSESQWGATATSAAPVVEPTRRRVISTAPRRVLEPIQVVRAPTPSTALPPGAPILAPTADRPEAERAARHDIAAFQTRTAARPALPARPKPQPIRQAPVESFLTPKVDRGVGVPRQPHNRQRVQKTVVPKASWQVATRSRPAPVRVVAKPQTAIPSFSEPTVKTAPVASPTSSSEPVATSTGSGLGQFFSGFFGSGSTASSAQTTASGAQPTVKPPATKPVTARPLPVARTASVARPAAAAPASPAAPVARVVKPVKVAAAQPPATERARTPATRPRARTRYEIEVATLRSKDRADALAQQLMVQYPGGGFWSKKQKARVKQTVNLGQDGAIYSVRYGVYDNKEELSSMCERFKADGLACAAVRQN